MVNSFVKAGPTTSLEYSPEIRVSEIRVSYVFRITHDNPTGSTGFGLLPMEERVWL